MLSLSLIALSLKRDSCAWQVIVDKWGLSKKWPLLLHQQRTLVIELLPLLALGM